jgi:hypothetical protein
MKKINVIFLPLFVFLFSLSSYSSFDTGLDLNKDMMGLKIKKNRKNPVKSGIMNFQFIKKGNEFFLGGSYSVDKKWWLPIKRNDSLKDRSIPAVIADYDLLMETLSSLKESGKNQKDFGWGSLVYEGEESVNGVEHCIKINIQSSLGEIIIWIHPTSELNYDDFRSPIFVKVFADADLPVLGKKVFELNLQTLNHVQF